MTQSNSIATRARNWAFLTRALATASLAGGLLTGNFVTPAMAQETTESAPGQQRQRRQRGANEQDFEKLLGDNAAELWRGYGSEEWPEGWKVVDGVLHRSAGGGDLVTKSEYANFELRFQWKVAAGGNSGIMYRVSLGDPAPYFSGPEYQVLDNERHADGKSDLTSAGSLYAMLPTQREAAKPAGEWNTGRIVVRGKRIRHFLNGQKVADIVIDSPAWKEALAKSKFADWEKFAKNSQGHIALQDHGDEVWYRNVRIRTFGKGNASEDGSQDSP